jgi:glycosyltransferase involved in cell wall biosynthesis
VATVHDVKPLLFGEPSSGFNLNRTVERLLIRDRWGRIDQIITDSRSSRDDILERLPVRADRVTVVYPGIDHDRFCPVASPSDSRPGVRPYVFCVAGADPTKNVRSLIAAFARLPEAVREAYDLVLAGDFRRRPELFDLARRVGVERRAQFIGVVDDRRLVELYQQATLFVFPSLYEGFGFPVLEAMACGCPVVCSNASSLPEIAGEAAVLVDPLDCDALARSIERVLSDPALRDTLRLRGSAQAARFSWDRTAREVVAVYERAAGLRP